MPYTAHRKDSRHRIVTDAEISLHTNYLDGEIESSQKGPVSCELLEQIDLSVNWNYLYIFYTETGKGSPMTAALSG